MAFISVSPGDLHKLVKYLSEKDLFGLYESSFNEIKSEFPLINKKEGFLSQKNEEMRKIIGEIKRYTDVDGLKNHILNVYYEGTGEEITREMLEEFLNSLFKCLEEKIRSHPKVREELDHELIKEVHKTTKDIHETISEPYQSILDSVSPEALGFIVKIMKRDLDKKRESVPEKSVNTIFESLKKKLGKDEIEKIKCLPTPDAKKRLEKLVRDKNLKKEIHAFHVIYRYLEKFTAGSQFLRVMDFGIGEGLPLDRMYVKLHVVEEKKKKKEMGVSGFYCGDYYYTIKEMWEREEGPSKKIDPDEIMDMDKGLVCILGLPGAGKTTLCKYFCWRTLQGEYTKQELPIYVELRGVEKKEDPVTYALHSKLKEHFTKEEIEKAIATIKHNTEIFSPLFIFDGLDEVKADYGIISESIKNCADSSLCVVTSRRSGFIYMQHDKTYEILPLEREEKKELVKNYFTRIKEEDKIDSFLQVLGKREYNSLSKNPMLLSILCALASDEVDVRNLPSRKSGLYKRITMKMNEWHRSKGGEGLSQEEIRKLEDLALSLFQKKRPRILFEEGIDESILDRAARVGIVYRWNESRYSFLHLTLQEYFAACSLRSLGREKWEEIIRKKKDAVAWHEIIQLFASILNEEEEYEELEILFSKILESPDILYLNYALAGHCLAEIDMDDVEGSFKILRDTVHEFERSVCESSFIEAFVHLRDKAVEPLIDLLQKTDDNVLKGSILHALGKIGDTGAVEPLIDLLKRTDDDDLKGSILHALGKIGDPRAVEPLIDLLKRTDDELRYRISRALGEIRDPRAVEPLIDLLKRTDDDGYLSLLRISDILGEIGNRVLCPSLRNLWQRRKGNYMLLSIPDALGRIGDGAAESLLDVLQKTDDGKFKRRISDALGEIGGEVVNPLIDLLKRTDDDDLKGSISNALGKIGDPRAVEPLIDLLKRTDDDGFKSKISNALGKIGDPRAVEPLIDLLKRTDDNELKWSISIVLGKIGDPRAVEPLIDLLKRTDDDTTKSKVSYALGEIGDSRAVGPLLDILQRTNDEWKDGILDALGEIEDLETIDHRISMEVYSLIFFSKGTEDSSLSISDALGMIGDPRAVEPLIDLLQKTDNNKLRYRISRALGEIGDPRAVEPLIDLLKRTDDDDLKGSILHALGKIGDTGAVEPLIDLLKRTDDYFLKEGISYALENFNPILLYSLIENQMLQDVILDVLCYFATKHNIRFFKDRIVLPEGEILYTGTERQREHSIKKLDKIIKL